MKKGLVGQLSWDESYSHGDSKIDSQHKNLIDFINQLPDEMDAETVKNTMLFLHKHAETHFSYEEKQMEKMNFPFLKSHRDQHKLLINKLDHIGKTIFNPKGTGKQLREFMVFWLREHFLYYDQEFANFIKTESQRKDISL